MVALAQDALVAQRAVQPAPQQAPAHRGDAGVDHAQQGVAQVAVHARIQLQMAARGGVHRDAVLGRLEGDGRKMRQALLLGFLDVGQQRPGRGDGARARVQPEACEIVHPEKARQRAPCGLGVEQPGRAASNARLRAEPLGQAVLVGKQQFGRFQSRQFRGERVVAFHFVDEKPPARKIRPGQPIPLARRCQGHQQGVAALVQQGFVGDGAGRDDTHHAAFHQPLGLCRIADLLADRDRFAQRHQAREIALVRMRRHSGHRDRRAARAAALGEGDVEQLCRAPRVVVEELVEVAHAEEQQHLRMLGLGREVLLHQRRVFGSGVLRGAGGTHRASATGRAPHGTGAAAAARAAASAGANGAAA